MKKHITIVGVACALMCCTALFAKSRLYAGTNQPPACLYQIGSMGMNTKSAPCMWPLSQLFSDDGLMQACAYTCSTSSTSVAIADIPTINGVNYFRIRSVGPGTTTGYLRANDGQFTTTMNFSVAVTKAPNSCPVVLTPFSPVTAIIGGAPSDFPLNIEINRVFDDPDGDSLTFDIPADGVPNPAIATASVVQPFQGFFVLRIVGIGSGTTTGKIRATDHPSLCSTVYTYTINVFPNRPPVVAQPISNLRLSFLSGVPFLADPTLVFSDPDGDVMQFQGSSKDDKIATVEIIFNPIANRRLITVTAVGRGSTVGTVTANDLRGHVTTLSFDICVGDPPVPSAVPAQDFKLDDPLQMPYERDLTSLPLFTDPDGDLPPLPTVPVVLVQPNPAIATAAFSDPFGPSMPKFTITPIGIGNTAVTVRATDLCGNTADLIIPIKVRRGKAPRINHQIVADLKLNDPMHPYTTFEGLECPAPPTAECIFADEDGDRMTFATVQGNTQVATIRAYRLCGACPWKLEIVPVGVGTTIAKVIADDGNNNQTEMNVPITVRIGERPVVHDIGLVTLVMGQQKAFGISEIFTDPEGGQVTARIKVGPNSYLDNLNIGNAFVDINSYYSPYYSTLYLTPQMVGENSVTLTGFDPDGNTVDFRLTIKVVAAPNFGNGLILASGAHRDPGQYRHSPAGFKNVRGPREGYFSLVEENPWPAGLRQR